MKKKNVMLLIQSLTIGGTERSVSNISKLLSDRHNVFVAVFNVQSAVIEVGGQLIDLRLPMGVWWRKPYVALKRILSLRRAIRKYEIDVLFGFTTVGCRYLTFAQKKTKRVLCSRGFQDIVRNETFYSQFLRGCDGLLFNSFASRHWFVARHPKLAQKTFVLQNCIDLNQITQNATEAPDEAFTRFAKGRAVIVSIGRLCDIKGFDFLIKAFLLLHAKMPNAGLVIVGNGPSMRKLKSLAEPARDSVLFADFQVNPFPYLAASQLYVLPSRSEGFPNALVEAMACGLPVIAANCESGPNEILNDAYDPGLSVTDAFAARYGMLVPPPVMPPDSRPDRFELAHYQLADAMRTMLTDEALRETYQRASLERARHFSFENSAARYEAFIDQLLDKPVDPERASV